MVRMNDFDLEYWNNTLNYVFEDSEDEEINDINARGRRQNKTRMDMKQVVIRTQHYNNSTLCTPRSLNKLVSIGILQNSHQLLNNNSNIWSQDFQSNHLSLYNCLKTNKNKENYNYEQVVDERNQENEFIPISISSTLQGVDVQGICKDSRFFIIKSFTQEDVLSSYYHGIWASTDLGNKRLSKAYKQLPQGGNIYLFFSVNASGRFCGVAIMKNDVDFTNTSDVWSEKSRWKGVFPIEWSYIKDIPNKYFYHLKILSNDNKPVTYSRDTQEVPFEIAIHMMNIFKSFKSKTTFLQDNNKLIKK